MRLPLITRRPWRARLLACGLAGLLGLVWNSSASAGGDPPLASEVVTPEPAPAPTTDNPPLASVVTLEHGREPTVILYGDSLASESQAYFQSALVDAGITDVHTKTFGGTALCDWLDVMRKDVDDLRPTTVVVEFSGNALTPCMQGSNGVPLTSDAYYAKYVHDSWDAVGIFSATHARVYFVGTPVSRLGAQSHDPAAGRLNGMYAEFGAVGVVDYVDAGAAVLDNGSWTNTLPCLPGEPCTGGVDATGAPVNVVRAPDGTHFCPASPGAVRGVTGDCPVWSSGAFRFGTAMADPVIGDLHSQ